MTLTRIDFGIASYESPDKLDQTLTLLRRHSKLDWRCLVIDNNSQDERVARVIDHHREQEPRISAELRTDNIGYAGAVNRILEWAETPYVGYIDNDAYIRTPGWDEKLLAPLLRQQTLGMMFPNGGAYPIDRGDYTEVLWGVGFCWIMNRQCYVDVGGFDTELGHQEEADYSTRLHLAGWRLAADPTVQVEHDATSSRNPDAQARINAGIINWVNKWCKYFAGPKVQYHSENVIRFEDWPPNALYLEEFYKLNGLAHLNDEPETTYIEGRPYDLIKVPRFPHFYRGRII